MIHTLAALLARLPRTQWNRRQKPSPTSLIIAIKQAMSDAPLDFNTPAAFNDIAVFQKEASFGPFVTSVSQILAEPKGLTIGTQTGFLVSGAHIARVTVSPGFEAKVSELALASYGLIEIAGQRRSGSIAVVFTTDSGQVFLGLFAILSGFIGNVTVGMRGPVIGVSDINSGIKNISYNPAPGSRGYAEFESERSRIDKLRASVAAAAGALYAGVGSEASRFGDSIRVSKRVDPTLSLYAAYAFDRAGRFEKTASVSALLASDLETEFFDTAMFAGKLTGKPFRDRSVVPFAPMLAQGWDLLHVKGAQLDPRLYDAWSRLRPALWTTFAPQDIELVSGLVRES
jgi:hypothetical protein